MSSNLTEYPLADRMIAKSGHANAYSNQRALGGDAAGNHVQSDANPVAIAGLSLDDPASCLALLAKNRHAQLAEGGVGSGPSILEVGHERLANSAVIVGVTCRGAARGSRGTARGSRGD